MVRLWQRANIKNGFNAHLAVLADGGKGHALGGNAASLLHRGGQALFPQDGS